MDDREKVIKGLEICYCPPAKCDDCPYNNLPDEQSCNDTLCLDALALLKEQEAIPPVRESDGDPGELASWWYVCGACRRGMDYHDKFCRWCGRKVKWDEQQT